MHLNDELMPEDITSNTLPDPGDTGADGGDTVLENVDDTAKEAMRISLSSVMGREFKTYEDALKSVKDTKDFVGSVGKYRNAIEKTAERLGTDTTGVLKMIESMDPNQNSQTPQATGVPSSAPVSDAGAEALRIAQETARRQDEIEFFSSRPELSNYKDMFRDLQTMTGKNLKEIAEMPNVKSMLDKAVAKDEADRSLSVLHSNPRIAAARDKMSEAREANAKGDTEKASELAVQGVIDAYGLGPN